MSTLLGPDNALAWSQFRLKGGWRNLLTVVGLYTLIAGGLILITARLDLAASTQVFTTWTMILLGLQVGILLLLAPGGIRTAVTKDMESGMIESHRLTPLTGVGAVAGYLTGPTTHAIAGGLVTFALGFGTAVAAGLSTADWLAANGILALFAACFWVACALLAMLGKNAFGALIGVLCMLGFSGGFLLDLFPGLTILAGPLLGGSIFGLALGQNLLSSAQLLSACLQLAVAGLCFLAAARRFCRNDVPAFGSLLGLALVLAWVLLSFSGMASWSFLDLPFGNGSTRVKAHQMIAAVLAGLIVALTPLVAAVRAEDQWQRRRTLNDPALGPRPIAPLFVALLASAILLLLPLAAAGMLPKPSTSPALMMATVFVTFTGLLQARYLVGVLYRAGRSVASLLTIWFALAWGGPLMLDLGRTIPTLGSRPMELSFLWTWSPIGLLMASLDLIEVGYASGLVVQGLLTIALAAVFHATRSRAESPVPPRASLTV